jgi:hypothetical protein
MRDAAKLTQERGLTYGPFAANALTSQHIKASMRMLPQWDNLPLDIKESLELIATKISRIIGGDHDYLDNWDDIGGYAKLIADRIRGKQDG